MKTMEELKNELHKAATLAERIAIKIKMIELSRLSSHPDHSIIYPVTTFLNGLGNLSYR